MNNDSQILLIEDNEDNIELALRAFKKSNILNRIDVCRNGLEAKEYLQKINNAMGEFGKPSIILLDLKLPLMNGLDLLRFIRSHEPTRLIPVIVLTSSNEEKDRIESYHLGANSYIQKPISFKRFVEVVQQIGMYWLALNKHPLRSMHY